MSYTICLLVFLQTLVKGSEYAVYLDCQNTTTLASPNYPKPYPRGVNEKWDISVPVGRRILAEFIDFQINDRDSFAIKDNAWGWVHYFSDTSNPSPFVSSSNTIDVQFVSFHLGTSRPTGIKLRISCNRREGAPLSQLVNGFSPEEGNLQIASSLNHLDWRRICSSNFQRNTAEVVCRELRYPGVQKVSDSKASCEIEDRCDVAPACSEHAFRLVDCYDGFKFSSNESCPTKTSIQVKCYKPGYKGCFNLEGDTLSSSFDVTSIAQCVSFCKTEYNASIAMVYVSKCTCTDIDLSSLQKDASQCVYTEEAMEPDSPQSFWMTAYDTSVGFCDPIDSTENGKWDSNITWFGSVVRLVCQHGYAINGSDTLQCVPGHSPYFPVWNGSLPTCRRVHNKGGTRLAIIISISILVLIVIFVILMALYIWCRKRNQNDKGQTSPRNDPMEEIQQQESNRLTVEVQEDYQIREKESRVSSGLAL